jgi:multidrug transporter EmrE-like cation transporter
MILAVLLVTSVSLAVAGQLTLKSAMERVGRIGSAEVQEPVATVKKVASEPLLWIGLTLFGVSAMFWLVVLSHVPLSVAYPVVGLSYILIVGFSRFILHESVPMMRWLGVLIVAIGIGVIGLSFRKVSGS